MTMKSIAAAVALLATLAFLGVAQAADEDDQGCDDIMAQLKTLGERYLSATKPKGPTATCAASGHVLGILRATRETANACYEDGPKLDRILGPLDKGIKDIEGQIEQACK